MCCTASADLCRDGRFCPNTATRAMGKRSPLKFELSILPRRAAAGPPVECRRLAQNSVVRRPPIVPHRGVAKRHQSVMPRASSGKRTSAASANRTPYLQIDQLTSIDCPFCRNFATVAYRRMFISQGHAGSDWAMSEIIDFKGRASDQERFERLMQ